MNEEHIVKELNEYLKGEYMGRYKQSRKNRQRRFRFNKPSTRSR